MENYIVRIYSRDDRDPEKVKGSLESIEHESRRTFKTWHELHAMLLEPRNSLDLTGSGESSGAR